MRFFFFLLSAASLLGASSDALLHKGNEYLKAGFFGEAESEYRKLLKGSLESWKQDIVFYNLGIALMEQKRFQQAIHEFLNVRGENTPPYLLPFLNRNLALSLVRQAYALQEEGESELANRLLGFVRGNFNLKLDLKPFKAAKENVPKAKPAGILRDAISDEEDALIAALGAALYQIRHQGNQKEMAGAKELQQKTLDKASLFIPSLLKWEKEVYNKGECLEKPFDKTVPLFTQGYQTAEAAEKDLKSNKGQAIVYQWETLAAWKKALKNWSQEKQAEASRTIQTAELSKTEQLVQQITEMNLEDGLRKKAPEKLKSVKRPW